MNAKFYENASIETSLMQRPSSASKTGNGFFDRSLQSRYTANDLHSSKPDLLQFYRKGSETPKSQLQEKENILKRAEEEATRKIE